jgi:chromate reductase, NAD(P)H dehydrogenase (quinone)
MKSILAICGSTKSRSTNLNLIHAIAALAHDKFSVTLFDGLARLPHFNPDLDTPEPPTEVAAFRQKLREADGILICTPEYAMGVPGSLKNAIDWTVSSCEFSHKPTALITASSVGQKGHAALLETLLIIEADIPEKTRLLIPHAQTKINAEGIKDEKTLEEIRLLISAFSTMLSTVPGKLSQ